MGAATGDDRRVAVVGATGAVGSQLVELLGERGFPFSELRLFASPNSAGEAAESAGRNYRIGSLENPADLDGFDLAFLAVPPSVASDIVRARPGPLLIDLSAAGRAPSGLPMVAPGLTPRGQIAEMAGTAVFGIPHPAAEALAGVLSALGGEPSFVGATLILGASAMGKAQVSELIRESADALNARLSVEEDEPQLAFNICLADHERELAGAIAAQVEALLGHTPRLMMRVVRAPLLHGTALGLSVAMAGAESAAERLAAAPGLLQLGERDRAGVVDAVGQEAICLSVQSAEPGLALWCTFDSARRAALSALWIAQYAPTVPRQGTD